MGAWVVQRPDLVKKYFRDHRTSNALRNPKLPYSLDILQRLFFSTEHVSGQRYVWVTVREALVNLD